jgi:4-hydroxy-2-oxoheptanedioate aldolase
MLSFKERIESKGTVFGTWANMPGAPVAEALSSAGLDFVVIDHEHGAISPETSENMVRACQLHGVQPIVRVDNDSERTLLHALETGAMAVMVPHVETAEGAERIVAATHYFPDGSRGLSPYTRCHEFTHENLTDSMSRHNDETFTAALVEGLSGIENLSGIASVDGLDMVYLGSYDISQSVGFPGELEHPDVVRKREECVRTILGAGCIAGTFSRDIDDCRVCAEMGFGFVAYVADSYGLRQFFKEAASQFRA